MDVSDRRLARLAARIHADLAYRQSVILPPCLPRPTYDHALRLDRQLAHACGHGWHAAARQCLEEYQAAVNHLDYELQQLRNELSSAMIPRPIANAEQIYHDLVALKQEFPVVKFNRRNKLLTAETHAVELENCYLGPFAIKLQWTKIGEPQPYRIVALDPHPAGGSGPITHPHVQDEIPCEGDATVPIASALASGRLFDFFSIVNQLLHTYNDTSPYVSLSRWDGSACVDCDRTINEDDAYVCNRCENLICEDCRRSCCDCGESFCGECCTMCRGCDEDLCRGCQSDCTGCLEPHCDSCLQQDERCPACHEDESEDENADATVHPNCVGEAAVSA